MSQQVEETHRYIPAHAKGSSGWQRWAPYAALVWSIVYAILGAYWAMGGEGFPYMPKSASDEMVPLVGQFGQGSVWVVVILAGVPAVAVGAAMLRGVRGKALRPLLIIAGVILAGMLLLLITGLDLLVKVAYIPAVLFGLLDAEKSQAYWRSWTQWATLHQVLCIIGGFLWLVATLSYARRSGGACVYCGRRDGPEGWKSPDQAVRWGRIAVYVGMVVPIFYAFTRYAWALGIPLGMTEEYLRRGQETGMWIGGLSLANFALVGMVLMFGLVQRWGEVFPSWMVGLAGHRVPIALAVVPASLVSVLLIVGGTGIWSSLPEMIANLQASGVQGIDIISEITFQVGPTLLLPVWGAALAVATLGYYYRRRGPCGKCGRGAHVESVQALTSLPDAHQP